MGGGTAIEAVPAIAHHAAGLSDDAQLLGQLQQTDLRLDSFRSVIVMTVTPGVPAGVLGAPQWRRAAACYPTRRDRRAHHACVEDRDRSC